MRIPVRPHSTSTLKRKLARAKLRVLEIAALMAQALGLGVLAAMLEALIVAQLRMLSLEVRANICLQALNQYRIGKRPAPRTIPRALSPGMRYRRKRAGVFRSVTHATFKGLGLASRNPEKLITAINTAIARAPRLVAHLLRRLNHGFKGQQPTLGRPPAQKLPAQPAPRAGFAADTS